MNILIKMRKKRQTMVKYHSLTRSIWQKFKQKNQGAGRGLKAQQPLGYQEKQGRARQHDTHGCRNG